MSVNDKNRPTRTEEVPVARVATVRDTSVVRRRRGRLKSLSSAAVLAAATSLVLSTAGAATAVDYDVWHPPAKDRDGESYSTAEVEKVFEERCGGAHEWFGQDIGTDCHAQHTSGHFDWSQTPFSPDLPGYRLEVAVATKRNSRFLVAVQVAATRMPLRPAFESPRIDLRYVSAVNGETYKIDKGPTAYGEQRRVFIRQVLPLSNFPAGKVCATLFENGQARDEVCAPIVG